jgi:hypothetical protein
VVCPARSRGGLKTGVGTEVDVGNGVAGTGVGVVGSTKIRTTPICRTRNTAARLSGVTSNPATRANTTAAIAAAQRRHGLREVRPTPCSLMLTEGHKSGVLG